MARLRLIEAIRKRAALLAVGPSTARGQGAPGVVDALREALADVPLTRFAGSRPKAFARHLDLSTALVIAALPRRARSWGLARKCLNIYLRDCYYNAYLRPAFGRAVVEDCFEVPLDRVVAAGLHEHRVMALPRWPGVKRVTPELSAHYQAGALLLAQQWGVTRVHLDTFLWVEGR